MPVSVKLRFTAPDTEDLKYLKIYEEASPTGVWDTVIETVDLDALDAAYPEYISEYETNMALSATDWFAIQWIGRKGAVGGLSNPMQGGTSSLVGEIVELVGQRDSNLDAQVVRQETEFAIETYFGQDPYTATTDSYRIRVGLARLVQARTMLSDLAKGGGSNSGWTAGLVSMKSGTTGNEKLVRWLLEQAAIGLGMNYARIAQMATMVIAGGMSAYDVSVAVPVLVEVE